MPQLVVLLTIAGVHKAFGLDIVLDDVTFRIDRREKVALVGRNGTGKTTLLRIITGQMQPDTGTCQVARGANIGYLRQEHAFDEGKSVLEEAEMARKEQVALRARLDILEARLEDHPTAEELDEYATLHEHYIELEGYSAERDLRTVLQRMGFTEEELEKPASQLSGGEKTRLALAQMLLEQPDLLILDEPTNHLDLQATEWLEGWLRSYPGAVLLVSHDREFLHSVGDRVLEMVGGIVKSYPGPFDKYLKLRAEEQARLLEVAKRQDSEIAKLDEFVRRFMNSQRTAQARGRLKMKEKLVASRVVVGPAEKGMKAGFGDAKRSGDLVLECKGLSKSFGPQHLFSGLDWTVRAGERWGVVGENGSGKSTLIKIILGLIEATDGQSRLGSNVVVGYFAQDTVDLNPDQSPLDYLVYEFDLKPPEARNLLGRFLFSGDDVFRPVKTLSGGEKNKLVLASLTILNPNVLILDEPTNHLDMASREALAEVIREFKGTLVLISHDRWLLEQVTDHTLDMRREGATQYPGSYGEYRRRKATGAPMPKVAQNVAVEPEAPKLSPRELSKEIGRLTKAVEHAEAQIHESEEDLKDLEAHLADLPANADVFALTQQYQHIQDSLKGQMSAWEDLVTQLEELKATQG